MDKRLFTAHGGRNGQLLTGVDVLAREIACRD